ncbi:MAG TPA: hypothetical protein VII78_05945 [Myxococcota bacterium]
MLAAFVGVGSLSRRWLGSRASAPRDLFVDAWLGFALTLLLLIVWHFFAPISGFAWLTVSLVGAIGLVIARGELRRLLVKPPWPLAIGLLGLAYFEANLSLASNAAWDSGLYHIQGVRWAQAMPVVPGLANLHGPHGFNNSGLLLFAMLDSGFWHHRANHVANGMMVLLLGAQALTGIWRLRSADARTRTQAAFDSVLLAPAALLAMRGQASSFVTDVAASAAVLALGSLAFECASLRGRPSAERRFGFVACLTLAAAAVTLRTNLGFYAAFLAALLAAWELADAPLRTSLRTLLAGSGAAGTFAAAWMLRGVVLSGYPLFPFPLPLPVDWAVPREHALGEYAYVTFTERGFAWDYASRWVAGIARDPFETWFPLLLGAALLALGLQRARSAGERNLRPIALLLPVCLALVAWFETAPANRYAFGLFWTIVAVAHGFAISRYAAEQPVRRSWCWAVLALGLLVPFLDAARGAAGFVDIARKLVVAPGPDLFFHPIYSAPEIETFTTDSGLVLNRVQHHCWDAPIPCTANPSPALRLRRAGDLRSGFSVDGKWQMQSWPYAGAQLDEFRATWRTHFPAADRAATR